MATSGQNLFAESTEHPSSHPTDSMRHRDAFRQRRAFVERIVALIEVDVAQFCREGRQ